MSDSAKSTPAPIASKKKPAYLQYLFGGSAG